MRTVLTILALWFAGLGAAAQFAKLGVAVDAVAALYPNGGLALGFLVSLIGTVGLVFGLVAGLLVARFGVRRIILSALLLGAILSFGQALVLPLPLMLATRVIEGASHLGIVVAAPTLMAQLADDRWRSLVMTLWSTFFGVAYALTAALGLPLIDVAGLPALFAVHGGVMLAVAALLHALLPVDRIEAHLSERTGLRDTILRHAQTYASPSIAAPAYGWLFYTLTFVSLFAVLTPLLPEATRAATASAMPVASLVASFATGAMLLPLMSGVAVTMLGFAAGALLAVGFAMVGVQPWLCIALFVTFGVVQAASFASVPQLVTTAEDRALANGAMAQMGNLGNTVGTPLALLAYATFGAAGLTIFTSIALGMGFAVHAWCALRR